jgi:hypothetical protein
MTEQPPDKSPQTAMPSVVGDVDESAPWTQRFIRLRQPGCWIAPETVAVVVGDEILFAQGVVSGDEVVAHGALQSWTLVEWDGTLPFNSGESRVRSTATPLALDRSGDFGRSIPRNGAYGPVDPMGCGQSCARVVDMASTCASSCPAALAWGAGVWGGPLGKCPSGGACLGWGEARGEGCPHIPGTRG